ncbi:hypothetical protein [Micromonospora wenchangensis]|uniref:hypothetical protein n=1 Tax=Micromonospora wenchangensis TaxID=1185415 RepID=UPI0037FA7B1A
MTASIAVIALIISAASAILQGEDNQRNRKEAAARVQTWWTLDSVIIQNSSVMPVTAIYINWGKNRRYSKMLIANTALPPCVRWTFSKESPEIVKASLSHALLGITFVQDGEVWALDNVAGTLEGPDWDLLDRPNLGILEWREIYATAEASSVCGS